MELQTITVHLQSVGLGMLHHNSQLSDPLNKYAKQLKAFTSKRKKTDDELATMAKIEFLGGLWRNGRGEPCVPGHAILATIRDGLKARKKGRDGLRGMLCHDDGDLLYEGPRKPESLWEDERFRFRSMETVPGGKVARTRPYFPQWELKFKISFNTVILDLVDITRALEVSGEQIGIGDRRPTNGRFEVVAIKEI